MKYFYFIILALILISCKEPVSNDQKKTKKNPLPPVAIIQNPINGATVYDSTIIKGIILFRENRTVDLFIDKQLKLSTKADTITYKWVVKNYPKFSIHTIILYVYSESETDPFESIATVNVKVSHTMIAFASNKDGEYELYIINDDGSQLMKLPYVQKPAFNPIWSEPGDKIAYLNKLPNQNNIYLYRLTDSTQKLIYSTNLEIKDLTWHHPQNKIVFAEDGKIVSIDTSGLNKQMLFYSYNSRYPSIGKNKEIFFNYTAASTNYIAVIDSNNNIFNVSVEGTSGKLIQPTYRPSSNNVYFINLQNAQLTYGNLKVLTGNWSITNLNPVNIPLDTLGYSFSPNGKSIVYINKTNKSLEVASYNGSGIKTIFQSGSPINPAWSKK